MASVQPSGRALLIRQFSWRMLQLKNSTDHQGRAYAAHELAKELLAAKLHKSAMHAVQTANKCRTANAIVTLASTSELIARTMYKDGCDKSSVRNAFIEELKFIKYIMEPSIQSLAAESACRSMLLAHFSRPEVEGIFRVVECQDVYKEFCLQDVKLRRMNGFII